MMSSKKGGGVRDQPQRKTKALFKANYLATRDCKWLTLSGPGGQSRLLENWLVSRESPVHTS